MGRSNFSNSPAQSSFKGSVAAIVVTYNRPKLLRQLLADVANQTCPVDETIIVDNAGSSSTEAVVRQYGPGMTYLRTTENLGPAGGFEAGMKAAYEQGHDWLWLFNDDNQVESTALKTCLRAAMMTPEPVIVCPVNSQNTTPSGMFWRGRPVPVSVGTAEKPLAVDGITFNGALFPRAVVDAAGFPRADYFMMFEEWEYCLRAREAGFTINLLPNVRITNFAEGSTGRSAPWRGYYQTRNHLSMALEHRSARELMWWAIRQTKYTGAIVLHGDSKLERIRLRALGAWDGLWGRMGRVVSPSQ